jgi:tetratricopeptide (TPR) repeat protein
MTPLHYNALINRARSGYQRGEFAEAGDACHQILKARKDDVEALAILHMLARLQRHGPDAIALAQRIIRAAPNVNTGYFLLADFHVTCGDYKRGTELLAKWLKKSPTDREAVARLARAYDMQGDLESAKRLIQPFIERGDESPDMALLLADNAVQEKQPVAAIALLEKHFASPTMNPNTHKNMCFTMGLACERTDRIDDAFEWYTRGHQILPYKFNLENYLDQIERTITTFSKERFDRMPRARVRTTMPIFLVCRPRSGSTLAECIVGSHPQVTLAGELNSITRVADLLNLLIGSTRVYPECVLDMDQTDADALASEFVTTHTAQFKNAPRIIIKHLDSWQHLGLISLLLPDATIIDLRRNAVDTSLACYSVHLGTSQPYSQDLRTLGLVHLAYERLMDHWRHTLGIRMLQINYEDLVADQEHWSRQLIEFCGLPWDEKCLRFHENAGATIGAMLSYQQVRQPIYKTSVGRAAKFAGHLKPLYDALGIEAPVLSER